MNNARYIEASIRARVLVFVLIGLFALSYFFSDIINWALPLPQDIFLHMEAVGFRNLLRAIFATCIMATVIYYVASLAITAQRHMEFPTSSMSIPIRMRVKTIARPLPIWLVASIAIVPLLFQITVMWHSWYSWNKLLLGNP